MATLFKNALASDLEAMYYDGQMSGISPRELSRFLKRNETENEGYKFSIQFNGTTRPVFQCSGEEARRYRRMYNFLESCFGSPSAICNLLFLKQQGVLKDAISTYKELSSAN